MFSMFSITAPLTTALGAAAIGLAIATAGTASAGTADDAFVTQMRTVGIEFKSPQAANHTGRQVCQELAAGKTGVDVAREIVSQTDMSPHQAAYLVVYATKDYCPQYADQLAPSST